MIYVILAISVFVLLSNIYQHFSWRNRMCPHCRFRTCVSNFSPCYGCKKGSNEEPDYGEDPV